ncbi:GLYCINE-RICH CELL WALL STRUCTURAL PROTEIN 1.8-LIKE [Salix purpurea]|uniref:GLYCINE-RICH CELL WALL STRUCTURAL PROTEIN 1.8-LIKE n=1 Tax=Salix purpurea TaxID=77065 RepID=A0A9Q0TY50_SALPP|nr:GLYCINE-RICH CELL WALL STRUCTURAL PROTEIN 1.8-LIKE [Salix purpurea]
MGEKTPIVKDTRSSEKFQNAPAAIFYDDEVDALAAPLQRTLVGKFNRMPRLEVIRDFFRRLNLLGAFDIHWFDYKHIFIKLNNDLDYQRLFAKRDWFFGGYKLRVLKWSVDFIPEKESSIVPVWISFPNLRYHLYEGSALLNLAKSLGPPIQMDEATAKGTRPSKARVCIEFDCLVEPPTEIWVQVRSRESGKNLSGYWQPVTFEKMPAYCTKCSHVGHHMANCILLDNNVRPRQPLKHDASIPKNDTKIASNNNLQPATEGGKKNKEEWVEVRHKKAAHKHVENNAKGNPIPPLDKGKSIHIPILLNEGTSTKTQDRADVRDTPLGNLIEEESRKLDKDDPIQPKDKGKSIETDNHPILVDDAKTQDREIDRETPSGSLSEIKTPVNLTASDNLKEANLSSKISTDSKVGDSQPIGLCGLNTNDTIPSNCNTIDSTKSLNSDGRSFEFENHPRILTRRNSEGDVQSHFSTKDLGKRNLHAEFNETAIAKVIDAIPLNICLND